MKKLFIITAIAASCFTSFAQDQPEKSNKKETRKEDKKKKINDLIRQDEEGVLVYSKQSVFGVQLRTNGYGFFVEKGKMKTQLKATMYRIDFSEIKHPKEDKLPNSSGGFTFGNPYIYGKINNFYQLQLSLGQQKILGQKGNKNGIAVSALYSGGLSMGLLRPYYIQVDESGITRTIKYTPQDSTLFTTGFIIGGAGLGKGWSEIKIKPGAFTRASLRFDFGRFNEVVSAIDIGISAEFYSSKIPIMLYQKEKSFYYQGHIAVMFGHRK